jgi:hypothetical protein
MSTNHKGKCAVKRVLLATDVVCLMTPQTANAKGCLKGAALGGVAGHMAHHIFLMCAKTLPVLRRLVQTINVLAEQVLGFHDRPLIEVAAPATQ